MEVENVLVKMQGQWWSPKTLSIIAGFLVGASPLKLTTALAEPRYRRGKGTDILLTPEELVQKQLQYFQTGDVASGFRLNSLENQAVTGPWENFNDLLNDPPFDVLLSHTKATVLMEIHQRDIETVSCLVRVIPSTPTRQSQPALDFVWELSKELLDDESEKFNWVVDSIMPWFEDLSNLDVDFFFGDDNEDPFVFEL